MMKNIAVILSGCGVYDGTEINEAVLTYLHLENNGFIYKTFAPNKTQHHVIDHMKGVELQETRNVLTESARIVRGNIQDLAELNHSDFDGIVVVGGFGVAKNISDIAFKGGEFKIDSNIQEVLNSFTNRPALYMCIAPVVASKIYKTAKITIGNCVDTAAIVTANNCDHIECDQYNCVVDVENKLVTTPAFMRAENVSQANIGIEKAIKCFKDIF